MNISFHQPNQQYFFHASVSFRGVSWAQQCCDLQQDSHPVVAAQKNVGHQKANLPKDCRVGLVVEWRTGDMDTFDITRTEISGLGLQKSTKINRVTWGLWSSLFLLLFSKRWTGTSSEAAKTWWWMAGHKPCPPHHKNHGFGHSTKCQPHSWQNPNDPRLSIQNSDPNSSAAWMKRTSESSFRIIS